MPVRGYADTSEDKKTHGGMEDPIFSVHVKTVYL